MIASCESVTPGFGPPSAPLRPRANLVAFESPRPYNVGRRQPVVGSGQRRWIYLGGTALAVLLLIRTFAVLCLGHEPQQSRNQPDDRGHELHDRVRCVHGQITSFPREARRCRRTGLTSSTRPDSTTRHRRLRASRALELGASSKSLHIFNIPNIVQSTSNAGRFRHSRRVEPTSCQTVRDRTAKRGLAVLGEYGTITRALLGG